MDLRLHNLRHLAHAEIEIRYVERAWTLNLLSEARL
jgi:hypothetical protein